MVEKVLVRVEAEEAELMVVMVMAAMERGDHHGRKNCGKSSNGKGDGGNSCDTGTVGMVTVVEVIVGMSMVAVMMKLK